MLRLMQGLRWWHARRRGASLYGFPVRLHLLAAISSSSNITTTGRSADFAAKTRRGYALRKPSIPDTKPHCAAAARPSLHLSPTSTPFRVCGTYAPYFISSYARHILPLISQHSAPGHILPLLPYTFSPTSTPPSLYALYTYTYIFIMLSVDLHRETSRLLEFHDLYIYTYITLWVSYTWDSARS